MEAGNAMSVYKIIVFTLMIRKKINCFLYGKEIVMFCLI